MKTQNTSTTIFYISLFFLSSALFSLSDMVVLVFIFFFFAVVYCTYCTWWCKAGKQASCSSMLVFYPVAIAISRFNSQFWAAVTALSPHKLSCSPLNLYAYFQHTRATTNTTGCSKKENLAKEEWHERTRTVVWAKSDYSWKFECNFHGITAFSSLFNLQFASFSQNIYSFSKWFSLEFVFHNLVRTIVFTSKFASICCIALCMRANFAWICDIRVLSMLIFLFSSWLQIYGLAWIHFEKQTFSNLNTNSNLFCLLKSLFVSFALFHCKN